MFVFTCLGTPFKYLRNLCLLGNQKYCPTPRSSESTIQLNKRYISFDFSECLHTDSKNPQLLSKPGVFNFEPDDVLLSLEIQPTIIGDKVFHCPVRNGKEWDHLSMVIRQRLCPLGDEFFTLVRNEARVMCLLTHEILFFDIQPKKLHGYRIKLHEQLVLVSLVSHNTYTPNLSTSWSRTTL